jgi:DNA repair photolyase
MTTPTAKLAFAVSILEEILKDVEPNSPTASKLRKVIASLDNLDLVTSLILLPTVATSAWATSSLTQRSTANFERHCSIG